MAISTDDILAVLDRCCAKSAFPMLDNGYVYLAATRLSLYRSELDWAMVIETFGFSPRGDQPDTCIETFASRLYDRGQSAAFYTPDVYEKLLAANPHNEMRFVQPIEAIDWQDREDGIAVEGTEYVLRGERRPLPALEEYSRRGIELASPSVVQVFDFCRCVAETDRDLVLATAEERRANVLPEMRQILQLEEWNHPDVADNQLPGGSETFRQLAEVLATGDPACYAPTLAPNTHWSNWPDSGTL